MVLSAATTADYGDIDLDASSVTLGAGDTGYFNITFSNPGATFNSSSHVDNILITGDVVPEPSAALLFGISGLGLILRRRRS